MQLHVLDRTCRVDDEHGNPRVSSEVEEPLAAVDQAEPHEVTVEHEPDERRHHESAPDDQRGDAQRVGGSRRRFDETWVSARVDVLQQAATGSDHRRSVVGDHVLEPAAAVGAAVAEVESDQRRSVVRTDDDDGLLTTQWMIRGE